MLFGEDSKKYFEELKRRSKETHAYKSYQLIGLQIAEILEDWKHKALYIKLAKEHGESKLLKLAKEVAEKKEVKNKGAYFMKVLYDGDSNSKK